MTLKYCILIFSALIYMYVHTYMYIKYLSFSNAVTTMYSMNIRTM